MDRLTYFLTELNVLHPFREGNGRAQREFIRCLALQDGYQLDWGRVEGPKILKAMILSPKDESELREVMTKVLLTDNQ